MAGEPKLIGDVVELLDALRRSEKPRDVYSGRDGRFYVTYGGGEVARTTVHQAVSLGEIAETFPDEGFEYWRLPTLVGVGDKPRRASWASR